MLNILYKSLLGLNPHRIALFNRLTSKRNLIKNNGQRTDIYSYYLPAARDSDSSFAQKWMVAAYKHNDIKILNSYHDHSCSGAFQYHRRIASTREQIA